MGVAMIFHCSTCDSGNKNSPLCIEGESFRFNDEIQDFEDLGSCRCICHRGSSNANSIHPPVEGGPGAYGDPDDNGEGTLGIERDREAAKAKELISVG